MTSRCCISIIFDAARAALERRHNPGKDESVPLPDMITRKLINTYIAAHEHDRYASPESGYPCSRSLFRKLQQHVLGVHTWSRVNRLEHVVLFQRE